MSGLRQVSTSLLVLGVIGCRGTAGAAPLHVSASTAGPATLLTLVADPGLKVNARVAPALELSDGRIIRFGSAWLSADSAYFAEPPTAVLPGRYSRVHGTLRASVCREREQVCRSLTLRL